MNELDYVKRKLDEYGKDVAHLLEKQEYSNFLNIYIGRLNYFLIKYQTLNDYVQRQDFTDDKEDEGE